MQIGKNRAPRRAARIGQVCVLGALLLLPVRRGAAGEPARGESLVVLGETHRGELSAGGSGRRRSFRFEPAEGGWYTLAVESADFDPTVRLVHGGRFVNNDAGPGLGEQVEFEIAPDETLRLAVGTPEGGSGAFTLRVERRVAAPPSPLEELRALREFLDGPCVKPDREAAWERMWELVELGREPVSMAAARRLRAEHERGLPSALSDRSAVHIAEAFLRMRRVPQALAWLHHLSSSSQRFMTLEPDVAVRVARKHYELTQSPRLARFFGTHLLFLGSAMRNQGRYVEARELYLAAGEFPVPGVVHAEQLNLLCELDVREGDYAAARERCEQAERARDSVEGWIRLRFSLDLVGHRAGLGDFLAGLRILDDIAPDIDASEPVLRLLQQNYYSLIYLQFGEIELALECANRGIELYESWPKEPPFPASESRTVIGLYSRRAACRIDWARMLPGGERAALLESARADLELARGVPGRQGAGPDVEENDWLMQGEILHLEGKLTSALELVEKALESLERSGSKDSIAEALLVKASLLLEKGDSYEAELAHDEVVRTFDNPGVNGLGPRSAARLRARFADYADVAQDLIASKLESGSDQREGLVLSGFEDNVRTKYRALVETMFARAAPSSPRDVSVDQVSAALGDERVLIDYADGANALHAYVLYRGILTHHTLDLDRWTLVGLVKRFCGAVFDPSRRAGPAEVAAIGWEAYAQLLKPILEERGIPEQAHLVVAPTLALSRLPFDALVTEPPSKAMREFRSVPFLLARHPVTPIPSARLMLDFRGPRKEVGDLLAAGDALTAVELLGGSAQGGRGRLTSTREEVIGVARSFSQTAGLVDEEAVIALAKLDSSGNRSARLETEQLLVCLGEEFALELFCEDLSRFAYLHLATHGEVEPLHPTRTGLLLSGDGDGAGRLTIERIRALELDAECVTLSACNSTRGPIVAADGIHSVAAAFLEAGARRVVATLDVVEDDVTADLMRDFYRAIFRDGEQPHAALRQAKLKMLRRQGARGEALDDGLGGDSLPSSVGHPFEWASFVLFGSAAD